MSEISAVPKNVVEKQSEAPKAHTKSAESSPKATVDELRGQRKDILLKGEASKGALTYFAMKEQKAFHGGDADTRSRAETSRLAATASVVESAVKQADTENQILTQVGREPKPFDRDATLKQYQGESAQKFLDRTLDGTHQQVDTWVLVRERTGKMYADVAKETK